jgi:hypothetical protein
MGRALIVIESLAAALLLVALAAAWAARRPHLLRWALPVVVVLAVSGPAAFLAYGLSLLVNRGVFSPVSLVVVTMWLLVFLIGSIVVLFAARRAAAASEAPDARPWSVGGLAVAFAFAAVLTAITVSNLDVAVKGQIAAVRVEAGAKALALAPPRPLDGPNAATIYRRAFAAFTPREQLPALLRDRAQAWQNYDTHAFDRSDKEQREFLDSQQRALALLREAAAVSGCAFDREWTSDTLPLDLPLPELAHLRHGAILLAYDALARANRGDGRGAIDNLAAIFGMARHVPSPLLLDLLTAAAIEKTGAKALEDVLSLTPVKAEDLARLKVGVGEPFRERLRRVFAMEEAWGMAAFVMIATGRARGSPDIQATTPMDALGEAMLDSPLYRVFFLEDDLAAYRRHMRTMRDNASLPAGAMLEGFDKQEQAIKVTRGGGILAGLLLPAAYKCLFAALDGDAQRGLVRLAVAAAAYKAKHDKLPEKLADLVPDFIAEAPADPYDGRSLRLHRDKAGLVIYSIGRDRKDDGGRPWDEEKQSGDLVFRLR